MKLVKFSIVGAGVTAIGYLVYAFLVYLGVNYQVALLLDYIVGIVIGYILNKYWTFSYVSKNSRSFFKYASSYVVIFLINSGLLTLFVKYSFLSPIYSQMIVLVFIIISSYWLQKKWVFK